MKLSLTISIIVLLLLIIILPSCQKDSEPEEPEKPREPWQITGHYIAGKMRFLNGSEIPFAFIMQPNNKATFIYAALKAEAEYTYEGNHFSTTINGENFSCIIRDGKIENISSDSRLFSIAIAVLYKKQDSGRSFNAQRFEGPLKAMNRTVLYNNYCFQFDPEPGRLKYVSNPIPYDDTTNEKDYTLQADGCIYHEETNTFGVILNNRLEIQTKLKGNYVLFGGDKVP